MARVAVVGSLNYDVAVRVSRRPDPGETVLADAALLGPGGKGLNQAVAAARLGASVTMVGRVGADPLGLALVETLEREGVDISYVTKGTSHTGVALITIDQSGENAIAVASGANRDPALPLPDLRGADAVMVQGEIDPAVSALALEAASLGVLNPAPALPEICALAPLAAVVIANRIEASSLPRFDGIAVTTLGAGGASASNGTDRFIVDSPTVDVVDTVGAGDAFCAAFAVAIAEKRSIDQALAFAAAAGALAVTRPGAAAAMPLRAEVDRLAARCRVRQASSQ